MTQLGFGEALAPNPPLRVIDDYGPVGAGASAAHYVRCENGSEYFLKGRSFSPTHPFVAANELITARLARHLGLPVLGHDVAEINGEVFFASQWMDKGTFYPEITKDLLDRCINRDRVYGVAVFDPWIGNVDRHAQNLVVRQPSRAGGGGDLLLLNDHSHCLVLPGTSPNDLASLVNAPVSGYFRLDFLREAITDRSAFETALAAVESVADDVVDAIVSSMPLTFLDGADAGAYAAFLKARRSQLRTLFAAEPGFFPNLS